MLTGCNRTSLSCPFACPVLGTERGGGGGGGGVEEAEKGGGERGREAVNSTCKYMYI